MDKELPVGAGIICLTVGDITRVQTDAIVNAANQWLSGGGGVDGAIHHAGGPSILEECRVLGGCATGEAKATGAGRLPARYVIHAVGPIWRGGKQGESDLLQSAYRRSLEVARALECDRVTFPAISTGVYGYPLPEGARVALATAVDWLRAFDRPRELKFVLFNQRTFDAFSSALDEIAPRIQE